MLLIDGVKYQEWMPQGPRAEDEFEREVKEHTQDIFGEKSIYLDRKQKLKSLSGIGSIPDGYVIILGDAPHWHIVEVELSSHPPHEHIVPQLSRFTLGIQNPSTQRNIAGAIYEHVSGDAFLTLRLKKETNCVDVHKFLSDLISKPPILTIIIEKATPELREALRILRYPQEIKVVEFQTFVREGVEGLTVHAHLFEPLYEPAVVPPIPPEIVTPGPPPSTGRIEIHLRKIYAARKWVHIPISGRQRGLFPGFKVDFELETDTGVITTRISSAPRGTPIGDPMGGKRIQGGLSSWYDRHPELKDGATLVIEETEPKKKYRLEIKKSGKEAV